MVQPMVTRTQRRIERKQIFLVAVLVVALAGGSFALGVMYGQRGVDQSKVNMAAERPFLPRAVQVAPPPLPTAQATPSEPGKLTFYENLPKGNQAPLGSGINHPPELKKPEKPLEPAVVAAPAPAPVAAVLSSVPAKVTATSPLPPPDAVATPTVKTGGAFVVQIASFRLKDDAAKLIKRLDGYQLKPFVESADLGQKGVWYRVLAGPFATRDDADRAVVILKEKEKLSAIVKPR